jgi:hypothetical protein
MGMRDGLHRTGDRRSGRHPFGPRHPQKNMTGALTPAHPFNLAINSLKIRIILYT